MRITIIYRFFCPDTAPLAMLYQELVPALARDGHEVRVIAGQPAYGHDARKNKRPWREHAFGADIKRVWLFTENGRSWLRALNMILFSVRAFVEILFGRKSDVYWTGTTPPIIQILLVSLAAKLRGGKVIYQVQDIHPEIAVHSKILSPGVVTRAMTFFDNIALKLADRVTVLSKDMADTIRSRSDVEARVINNFALGLNEDAIKPERQHHQKPKFVFAGNIGVFQNLHAFVAAFGDLDPSLAELHFVGDGKAKPGLQELVTQRGLTNVYFHDRMSASQVFEFLQQFDVGVVSLDPGLYRLAYPTKVHTYFAAGLRIFALIEEDSALAQTLMKYDAGRAVSWQRSKEELLEALKQEAVEVAKHDTLKKVPKEIWHQSGAVQRWIALLDGLQS